MLTQLENKIKIKKEKTQPNKTKIAIPDDASHDFFVVVFEKQYPDDDMKNDDNNINVINSIITLFILC